MKKNTLLNAELSYLIAKLGHTDEITICDAGLPIPEGVQRIDLALTQGIPGFLVTLKAILSEFQVESVVMAHEFAEISPELHDKLLSELGHELSPSGEKPAVEYVSHEAFKTRTQRSRAIIRTGECTPYANVILKAGVVF